MKPSELVPFLIAAIIFVGCATMKSDFEAPTVNVTRIRPLDSDGFAPKFEIGLHILNPNRTSLKLHGIVYTLSLEGHDLLTGVAKELPVIQGYGEGNVTLVATASMLNSIRFLSELMNEKKDTIAYSLNAKLDFGGLAPVVHVQEKGEINLSGR